MLFIGQDWGEAGRDARDLSPSSLRTVARAGDNGGSRIDGSPGTLGFLGCEFDNPFALTLPYRFLSSEDSRGLRQGGDLTTHDSSRLSSPSSSSLMKAGSICCNAYFSVPVATFMRLMKSWKESVGTNEWHSLRINEMVLNIMFSINCHLHLPPIYLQVPLGNLTYNL